MVNLYNQGATQRPGEEDAMVLRLEEKGSKLTIFLLSEILHATCNFSEENRLGQGGFGPVYKVNARNGHKRGGKMVVFKRVQIVKHTSIKNHDQ
jgi:hypothetical protein